MTQVLIVTGGSGGIGAEVAKLAAKQGFSVCVNYHQNAEKASAVCEEITNGGGTALAVKADVSEESEVISLFEQTTQVLGKITALVNNAGVIMPITTLELMSKERLRNVFDINVIGSFLCAREAVKRMSQNHGGNGGVIINLSSIAASLGSPNEFIDYAATKGAIDTLTVGLAKEVANQGIRVNAVRPGLIATKLHAHAGDSQRAEKLKNNIPMKRVGDPTEVANAVLWLLSDSASYVTGALLDVSGGR